MGTLHKNTKSEPGAVATGQVLNSEISIELWLVGCVLGRSLPLPVLILCKHFASKIGCKADSWNIFDIQ
jgi:hypothetical protein